jgi:spore coat protein U-like protein
MPLEFLQHESLKTEDLQQEGYSTIRNFYLAIGIVTSINLGLTAPCRVTQAATAMSTIAVTATVLSFCTVTAAPLVFGNYSSAQLDTTTLLTVVCTLGTTYAVGLDQGAGTGATVTVRQMAGTVTGSTLAYTIYSDSARTTVWGNTAGSGLPQILTGFGRIVGAQLSAPGAFADTVTATLTY